MLPREAGIAELDLSVRSIAHRVRAHGHAPIARLMSPSDLGTALKPFVFLDLFDHAGPPFDGALHPPAEQPGAIEQIESEPDWHREPAQSCALLLIIPRPVHPVSRTYSAGSM